jgi:aspartyl-tRNA(Asn)/glutamyl-tRNA(Gln) amidotransferase subunit C
MKLTKEQIEKLAQLCRLKLTPEEVEKFSGELTEILDYVEVLGELDTKGVKETAQVTGLANRVREDEIDMSLCEPGELLETSPLPKQDNQIKINRMM